MNKLTNCTEILQYVVARRYLLILYYCLIDTSPSVSFFFVSVCVIFGFLLRSWLFYNWPLRLSNKHVKINKHLNFKCYYFYFINNIIITNTTTSTDWGSPLVSIVIQKESWLQSPKHFFFQINLISFSHLRGGLPIFTFPSVFSTKISYTCSSHPPGFDVSIWTISLFTIFSILSP